MLTVRPPISKAIVMVCEKCGKRLDRDAEKNPSKRLVSRLKKAFKKQFERDAVRALSTSCMNICPEDQVSVAITMLAPSGPTRFFTVPLEDVEATSAEIVRQLGKLGTSSP